MESLRNHILPVLRNMPAGPFRAPLLRAFANNEVEFATIEHGFRDLTSRRHDPEILRRFFASWSQTNNSAMTVAGISNRLTLKLHRGEPVLDPQYLLQSLVSLHRIIDEDLAVTHKILHSKMFHIMATDIVGDDAWLQNRYIDRSATDFKTWKDHMSLREPDIALGLLTTLVHEIYTHGEVEFILPLFRQWLIEHFHYSEEDTARPLRWIAVHCGGTEKNHFFHAVNTLDHYARAFEVNWDDYDLHGIAAQYLSRKAEVLRVLFPRDE
ncbi:hypothetical protein UAJ10_05385 [Nitrospirillum sp. BR 11164]|uniref:hypothetical protein n=1 Tax=Nitrospirillum sp. BR 11164 TaxID=3104324 RepID=UPI002AFFA2DC|nr:hypothetical protein [Nitrospirillum sp. BR 11164]MEA1648443.1 hypothetical protein [Nitrospirillum sp. BR 11164]